MYNRTRIKYFFQINSKIMKKSEITMIIQFIISLALYFDLARVPNYHNKQKTLIHFGLILLSLGL